MGSGIRRLSELAGTMDEGLPDFETAEADELDKDDGLDQWIAQHDS